MGITSWEAQRRERAAAQKREQAEAYGPVPTPPPPLTPPPPKRRRRYTPEGWHIFGPGDVE